MIRNLHELGWNNLMSPICHNWPPAMVRLFRRRCPKVAQEKMPGKSGGKSAIEMLAKPNSQIANDLSLGASNLASTSFGNTGSGKGERVAKARGNSALLEMYQGLLHHHALRLIFSLGAADAPPHLCPLRSARRRPPFHGSCATDVGDAVGDCRPCPIGNCL